MVFNLTDLPGKFTDNVHLFPVRIYYEDTDVSGFVYHANYLRYMERARSDWVMQLGMDQRAHLEAVARFFFVVRSVHIEYLRPAFLNDVLVVETRLQTLGGASAHLSQRILRENDKNPDVGQDLLTEANVRIAVVGADGRPQRLPNPLRMRMSALLQAAPNPAACSVEQK